MVKKFDYKITKDPYVFQQNRLNAHAEMKTLINHGGEWNSNRIICLDGVWNFAYSKNYALAPKGFENADFDCRYWDKIKVPGHIQMQGYDIPHYTNTAYPWDSVEKVGLGEVPEKFNPVGNYVKYFYVPKEYVGKRVRISFQGVESGAAIWLNGNYVGYMENSFDPSDFDISSFVCEGENKLAVQVFKWTSGSWCEDQDFFRFSGIYRSVYIYVIPEVHIEDYKVTTKLSSDYENAVVKVSTRLSFGKVNEVGDVNEKKITGKNNYALKVRIAEYQDCWENNLPEIASVEKVIKLTKKQLSGENIDIEFEVANAKLWSAEKPNLYKVQLEIVDDTENGIEQVNGRFGIREFKLINNILCLNGKRIVFKGVNRHEFSSRTGRTVSDEEILQDIVTMKKNNINAIRTSHYPDDVRIYELCDEYGIYMIAENNMETHGTWCIFNAKEHLSEVIPGDDLKWEPMLLDRVNSCYQRDKNHPAILMWSLGNESYGGPVIKHMSDKFRELDPDRPIHYEGVVHDGRYPGTSDVLSMMYPSAAAVEDILSKDSSRPFVLCEYSHAMGNSCGGIHKYTELADRVMSFQGGFIWDYIDQSIYKKDRFGNEFQAYGGDFGDRPADYNFSGNGIVYGGDRTPSPKMQEVKFCYQNIELIVEKKKIKVKNKSLFTNTNEYTCIVKCLKNGHPWAEKEIETNIEPLSEGNIANPFGELTQAGEYCIIASLVTRNRTKWCEIGHEIAFGQGIFKVKEKKSKTIPEARYFEVVHGQQNISARGDNFEIMFVHGMGGIVSYKYCGKEYINLVPKPNFWRAATDNDNGNRMVARMAQWKIASLYVSNKGMGPWQVNYPEVAERKDSLKLTYTYNMPTTPAASCTVSYTVNSDGRVDVEMRYLPVKELGDMPEFGMMYVLDADLCNLEWYGLGPEETYSDRCKGGKLGIYKNKVADNMAKYLVPQECGNKVGVRYAKVTDDYGDGLLFTADEASFSALPFTPHELELASHPYELPNVHHTVVRIAKAQMGVGGDDSWGAPVHPEYHINIDQEIVFNYSFKGIAGTENNP